jgi:2-Cys peroxiredoxin 5
MFAARRFVTATPRAFGAARAFQSSARANVKVGDAIPDIELVETSPGNKVNIAKELQGKGIIVGVPAAFSMLLIIGNHTMVHQALWYVPAANA